MSPVTIVIDYIVYSPQTTGEAISKQLYGLLMVNCFVSLSWRRLKRRGIQGAVDGPGFVRTEM